MSLGVGFEIKILPLRGVCSVCSVLAVEDVSSQLPVLAAAAAAHFYASPP